VSDSPPHDDQPDSPEPSGLGAARPPYTPGGFIEASRRFAHAAADEYSPKDAPFFFLHAGAAVELLLKAALCAANPALLIDWQRGNDDSLIRLVGYMPFRPQAVGGGPPRHSDRPPYTIGLAKAMARYALLYGPDALGKSQDEFDLLKAARDLAAHGEGSREVTEDMHRVLVTLATVVDAVLPHLDESPGNFWGDHADLIAHAMDTQRDKVLARARTLISAATRRFEAKYNGVPKESLKTLMNETVWQSSIQSDEWPRVCPACGSEGISRVRPEIRHQEVNPHHPKVGVAGFKAIDFRCPICNLTLESEELVDAVGDFEAWEEADDDFLAPWAEEFGIENLTPEEQRDLGFHLTLENSVTSASSSFSRAARNPPEASNHEESPFPAT
jgi:hypothetical protein